MDIFVILIIFILMFWFLKQRNSNKSSQTLPSSMQISPEQREMYQYIINNRRPFKFDEWIYHTVDPRQLKSFLSTMGMLVGLFIIIPLIVGLPIYHFFTIAFLLFFDYTLYMTHLTLEVTLWNPEFMERFGHMIQK